MHSFIAYANLQFPETGVGVKVFLVRLNVHRKYKQSCTSSHINYTNQKSSTFSLFWILEFVVDSKLESKK